MAVILRSAHPDALWPGVFDWFGTQYKDQPEMWPSIFERVTSTKHMEISAEGTFFGLAPEKAEGAAYVNDEAREGYKATFTNKTYALGYICSREEMEDGQYKELSEQRASALAYSMRQTKEVVHANVLNRAFNSSYLGGDGATLCSTAHVTRSGNQANRPTVDADLSEASIEDAVKNIHQMKNARGLRIYARALKLIVGTQEMFNAERYLMSTLRPGTANNDANAIRSLNVLPQGIMEYPFLTDDDAWYITTTVPRSLRSFDRRGVDFQKDEDFGTENARAKSTMRFVPGWADWRGIYGTQGAG